MAKHSFLGGLVKFTAAAAAVTGVCYLFKDEIKGSKAYQQLEVDDKLAKAKTAIKDTKNQIKEKAPWSNTEDEIIEDDEIILDTNAPKERDYVSIDSDAPAADEDLIPAEEAAEPEAPAVEAEAAPAEEEAAPAENNAETIEL